MIFLKSTYVELNHNYIVHIIFDIIYNIDFFQSMSWVLRK